MRLSVLAALVSVAVCCGCGSAPAAPPQAPVPPQHPTRAEFDSLEKRVAALEARPRSAAACDCPCTVGGKCVCPAGTCPNLTGQSASPTATDGTCRYDAARGKWVCDGRDKAGGAGRWVWETAAAPAAVYPAPIMAAYGGFGGGGCAGGACGVQSYGGLPTAAFGGGLFRGGMRGGSCAGGSCR